MYPTVQACLRSQGGSNVSLCKKVKPPKGITGVVPNNSFIVIRQKAVSCKPKYNGNRVIAGEGLSVERQEEEYDIRCNVFQIRNQDE